MKEMTLGQSLLRMFRKKRTQKGRMNPRPSKGKGQYPQKLKMVLIKERRRQDQKKV